jgi:hypothetical protein
MASACSELARCLEHSDQVVKSICPFMAQVERVAIQFQSLSEKTSDVFALLPESRHIGRSCLALHGIPLPIDLPPGVGSVFDGEFDDVRDSH